MGNVTVNISFQDGLLREIDKAAKTETRSRSEFLREAARVYINRKERWAGIFAMGQQIAKEKSVTSDDVAREITAYRKSKA